MQFVVGIQTECIYISIVSSLGLGMSSSSALDRQKQDHNSKRQSSFVMSHDLPVKSPTRVHVKPLVASGEHHHYHKGKGHISQFCLKNSGRHSNWKLSSMVANPNLPEYCCGVVVLAPAIMSGGDKGTRNTSTNSSLLLPES